jgi:hypothetical protein
MLGNVRSTCELIVGPFLAERNSHEVAQLVTDRTCSGIRQDSSDVIDVIGLLP